MSESSSTFLDKTLDNVEVHLVSIVIYDETKKIKLTDESDIRKQIEKIIEDRYSEFDNNTIKIEENQILKRITYIVFPIWKLDELLAEFQNQI